MTAAPTEVLASESLLEDGWTRRFLAAPDRVDEAVALYEGLGFEVHVEQLSKSQLGAACGACSSVVCTEYVLIYTRRPLS